ncbi:AT-rich interactive domain-containing protein 6-like isoform X4 [Papaver somniferum]|uniref:AT-rich interactive domain-containing protein 6-like isoform X4 n=1 Tax=Papaver somniferum TaxID=3469 RepID=UPI000E70194F|nr:AT-rich interactive domain-containing protein 6-like isoform X4 [Papaver somniferum]
MKDNEVMAGQDSTDTSGGEEEMVHEEVEEHEESVHSEGDQSPDENGIEHNIDDDEDDDEPERSKRDDPDEEDNEEEEEEDEDDDDDDEEDDEDDEVSPVNHVVAAARTEHKFVVDDDEEELNHEETGVQDLRRHRENGVKVEVLPKKEMSIEHHRLSTEGSNQSFATDVHMVEGDDPGTEEEQAAFMKELENFFMEKSMEFKPPKFYGEGLNCLKLWRAVTRLGGYDQVTTCKLWRQVGESFNPPKTCTTVSWSFRGFYEKALLEYERHKMHGGELHIPASLANPSSAERQVSGHQAPGPGRARRDAAARAMQGWHSQRLLGNGEVGDPIIKEKNSISTPKRDKHLKNIAIPSSALKRKKASIMERSVKSAHTTFKTAKPQVDTMVADIGNPADWVKINVRRTGNDAFMQKDCFEVYALVPGLLREEVRVQSDPAGRLVISGDPERPDNPWGVTPFKKVISLPSRIDPHQTSAVVTLHGQLFVRVPFEQSDL